MQIPKFFLFMFSLFFFISVSEGQDLSDKAEISILSFGPGDEVYAIWGHTAIRIKDPVSKIDKVYNYGTFDFDTPDFLMKFLRGKLDYALSIQRYNSVIRSYKREDRWIKEQILDLNNNEKEKLYLALEKNYLTENRFYKYDFFYDNCATRPQQIVEDNLDEDLLFMVDEEISFRDILDEHLIRKPWLDFGIDLIIGARADEFADERQQMFMPLYFYDNIGSAQFEESGEDIVNNEISIYESKVDKRNSVSFFTTPLFLMYLLLIFEIFILILSIRRKKLIIKWYDLSWFTLIFIASLVISFMWFATDHLATKDNWNLLWMNPLFIFLIPLKNSKLKKYIASFLFGLLILVAMLWFVIPQSYHLAFLPMIFILIIKCYKYAFMKS